MAFPAKTIHYSNNKSVPNPNTNSLFLFSIGLLHRVAGDFRPLSENRRQVSDVRRRMSRIGQRSLMI